MFYFPLKNPLWPSNTVELYILVSKYMEVLLLTLNIYCVCVFPHSDN